MATQNIKVNKADLLKALQLASRAIAAKPVIPLLGNVLLEVEDGNARLSGNDYSIGIRSGFAVTGKGVSFQTAVPAKLAVDLVNSVDAEVLELKFDQEIQQITLKTEKSKNNIKCMDPSDYPAIDSVVKPITVPVQEFKDAVLRVSFAASTNTNLISPLVGVLIAIENGKLVLFAVDGFHLSYEEIELNPIDAKKELRTIVNADILEGISRMLDGDFFEMSVNETQTRFRSGSNEMAVQKIDGKFPDHTQLRAAIGPAVTTITANTLELLRATKQLELFTSTGFTILEVKGMLVEVTAEQPEQGSSMVTPAAIVTGESIAVGLNITLLKQFLQVCKTETFTINFAGAKSPMLLMMDNVKNFYHVIMPMGLKK
jgi:DNA polymerase-3 subunit beta